MKTSTILSYITFIGIIMHEFSHYLMCKLLRLRVKEVKFLDVFNDNGKLGYVVHEKPSSFIGTVIVSISPFIINHMVGIIIIFYSVNNNFSFYIIIILNFIAFSLFFHSIPSITDIRNLIPKNLRDFLNPFLYLFAPFILFLLIIHKFSTSIRIKIVSNILLVLSIFLSLKYFNVEQIYSYIQIILNFIENTF